MKTLTWDRTVVWGLWLVGVATDVVGQALQSRGVELASDALWILMVSFLGICALCNLGRMALNGLVRRRVRRMFAEGAHPVSVRFTTRGRASIVRETVIDQRQEAAAGSDPQVPERSTVEG